MSNCYSCQNINLKKVPYVDNTFEHNPIVEWSSYEVSYCQDCGFGIIYPHDLTEKKLVDFYTNAYRTDEQSVNFTGEQLFSFFDKNRTEQKFLTQALTVSLVAGFKRKTEVKFLDIGCGPFGNSFNSYKNVFPEIKFDFCAIDTDPITINNLKHNDVKHIGSTYQALTNYSSQFDFIMFSHYFEHLTLIDIPIFLKLIHNALRKDGMCFIEVPNDDFRVQSRHDKSSSPHTLFFTEKSLVNILESNGFSVVFSSVVGDSSSYVSSDMRKKIDTVNNFRKIIPYKLWKVIRNIKNMIFRKTAYDYLSTRYSKMNRDTGDILRVVIKKR